MVEGGTSPEANGNAVPEANGNAVPEANGNAVPEANGNAAPEVRMPVRKSRSAKTTAGPVANGAAVTAPEQLLAQPLPAQARRRRVGDRPAGVRLKTIAVTGAAGVLGQALTVLLRDDVEVGKVIAIDLHRGEVDGVAWRIGDVTDPLLGKRLSGVDAIVHLALDWSLEHDDKTRTALNVRGTQTVVTAAAAAGVRHVVLVTSAQVYGAQVDNDVPLAEAAPLQAVPEGILADLLEIERLAVDARRVHRGLAVTVVRPAALVGKGVDTFVTRHFAAPRLLCVRDARPLWQFLHIDDLATALQLVALGRVDRDGVPPLAVTAGADGWLEQAEVEAISGRKRVEVPASLAFATAERLHRVGVTPAPASELSFVVHPWVIDSARLHQAGWNAEHDNIACLRLVLEEVSGDHTLIGRRIGLRDASVAGATAAGATAAVLGAAALVRRARRARGY